MNRDHIWIAVQNALVSLVSYLTGYCFTNYFHRGSAMIGALWCMISAIVVLQATTRETLKSAMLRMFGTFIGAIISGFYLYLLPFSAVGMAVSVGVTVLLCRVIGVPDNGRLAAITVTIVMVVSNNDPTSSPISNAALRFIESCFGAGIAVLVVLLSPKDPDAAT